MDINKKMINTFIAILNLILFGAMVTVNALAVILPINGKSTSELSDSYPNLFVPAGITFSIWGIIYLLLLTFTAFRIIAAIKIKDIDNKELKINILFGITCILNVSWILAWHYELIFLSVAIMLMLLGTLCYLFLIIDSIKPMGISGNIAVKLPVSVYLGWISVATIANISAMLVFIKWDAFGISESIFTVIMILAGLVLAILSLVLKKNIGYAMVIVWAYYGIIIKRSSETIVYNNIIYTCYAAIGIILVLSLLTVFRIIKEIKIQKGGELGK